MPAYRPSCVINLKLKFDETLTLVNAGEPESVQGRVEAPSTWGSGGSNKSKTQPLILQSSADQVSWVMARIPTMLNFEKPGYRQSGKFSLQIPFRELPIDPRTVRAAALEIHLGTVGDSDFAQGYKSRDGQGRLLSVLQTRNDDGTPNATTLRMVGVVDEWEVSNDPKGSIVAMNGRDLRGILLDTPVAPKGSSAQQMLEEIDWGQNIQQVVAQILAYNPFFSDFKVVVNAADWPNQTLPSPGFTGIIPRHKKGARGKKKGGISTNASSSSLNFWDLIVRACYLVGGIPYFQGLDLIIRPSATVYDRLRGTVDPQKNPTPFKGGDVRDVDLLSGAPINPALRTRRLVYGRDTETLKFGRKYGGWRRPKTIRVVSLDLSSEAEGTGKLLEGVWPPQEMTKAKVTRRSPGREVAMEEILNIPVPGVVDPVRLQLIAKSIYNEIGRGELGGEVSTKNLASFGGDNSDPDLLRLDPGDGVELLIDTRSVRSGAPLVSTFTDASRRSFEDQVREILKSIPDQNLARVIVATARGQIQELQRFFRVENVKFSWDASSGVKVSFDFQNYVVARAGDSDTGKTGPVGQQSVPAKKPPKKGNSLGSL